MATAVYMILKLHGKLLCSLLPSAIYQELNTAQWNSTTFSRLAFFFFFTSLRQNLIWDWPLFVLYKPSSPACSNFFPLPALPWAICVAGSPQHFLLGSSSPDAAHRPRVSFMALMCSAHLAAVRDHTGHFNWELEVLPFKLKSQSSAAGAVTPAQTCH